MSDRCASFCRDRRPPAEGAARKVAEELERQDRTPAQMRALLADVFEVERFSELCYSHADAIKVGLTKSILADDLATYPR